MAKKELSEKKLKKLIKKLKDTKKKKRTQKKDATVSQRVTQKVIIGSNIKDKNDGNAGRSFPIVQFLPQQNMDTQLLRDLLLRNNSSPLTREVVSKVPYKPSYDTSDQYGLQYNDNTFYSGNLGSQYQDNQSYDDAFRQQDDNISMLSDNFSIFNNDGNDFDTTSLLQSPPEKQGTLNIPIPKPKPNALAQSNIPINVQRYMEKESDLFSRTTEQLPADDEFERQNYNPILKEKPKTPNSNKKYLPEDFTIDSADTEVINSKDVTDLRVKPTAKKPLGRPKGSKNKPKDTSKVFTEI
jgi:hypothetical protein